MINEAVFLKSVESAFSPLTTNFDFKAVDSGNGHVRFDSPFVSVEVTYDYRKSYEVGVEFFELRDGVRHPNIPFNLGEVFREHSVPDVNRASFFQSSKEDEVVGFLRETAIRLAEYCEPCLRGSTKTFEALKRRRSVEAAEYTRRMQIESVRGRAEEAWRTKNYQGFIALFNELADSLPESDQKKLAYAIKQCEVSS